MRRDVFQAIADPTRRSIILLLAAHSLNVSAIAEHFNMSRQAVSKHIHILVDCALVKHDIRGREIYYQLNGTKMKELDKWIEQFKKVWECRFNALDKVLRQMKTNN